MDGLPKFANVMNEPRRMTETPVDLGPNGLSIDLLRAIYRNPAFDLSVRMRAAQIAINFECPKLAVVAQITENDLVARFNHFERN